MRNPEEGRADRSPLPEAWHGKPYNSLNAWFREMYGVRCEKIAVDALLTCPNRDGTLDTRGCTFCAEGSGRFSVRLGEAGSGTESGLRSVPEQIEEGLGRMRRKTGDRFVIYFQAYTNTYGPVPYLRKIFTEALSEPSVIGISVGTRPDCLGDEVLALLSDLQAAYPDKFIWVELGLQTIHEETARRIRRCYPLCVYEEAVRDLSDLGIPVITHVILGLPGEGEEEMLQTVDYLNGTASCPAPFGVKLQLLHILSGTDLAKEYAAGQCPVMTEDEYLRILILCIRHLRPEIVLHRVTGDGPKELLLAPAWSADKRQVLNRLHRQMLREGARQGDLYRRERE